VRQTRNSAPEPSAPPACLADSPSRRGAGCPVREKPRQARQPRNRGYLAPATELHTMAPSISPFSCGRRPEHGIGISALLIAPSMSPIRPYLSEQRVRIDCLPGTGTAPPRNGGCRHSDGRITARLPRRSASSSQRGRCMNQPQIAVSVRWEATLGLCERF
jgi:hypothetical protein